MRKWCRLAQVEGGERPGVTTEESTEIKRENSELKRSTPEYTASVMVLNPKEGEDIGGFGGGKPATIWHDAKLTALAECIVLNNCTWVEKYAAVACEVQRRRPRHRMLTTE